MLAHEVAHSKAWLLPYGVQTSGAWIADLLHFQQGLLMDWT